MNEVDRPGRRVVTGALVEHHEDKMSPPDARVSHSRFFYVRLLLSAIVARLRRHEDVTVTLFPRGEESPGETHDVHLSD